MSSETCPLVKNSARCIGESTRTTVFIERPLFLQEDLHQITKYEPPQERICSCDCSCQPSTFFKNLLPVFQWLPDYHFTTDFLADVISGLTVAVMHIPQGMAYGLLGNLPPVAGIYMAFFPVLVYFFFTTSKHASMGAIGIVCLMTGKVVSEYSSEDFSEPSNSVAESNRTFMEPVLPSYTSIEVATTVTFTVGIVQLLMYLFRLGALSSLLSKTLVNGFTTGAGVHIILSQLKDLLGLNIQKRIGLFKNGFIVGDAVLALPEANHIAIFISFVAIVLMHLNNKYLKPWLSQRTKIPIPIELTMVCLGTLVSYLVDLNGRYEVPLVGDIPTGLPEPALPIFPLIPKVIVDSISIAIVSYAITLSMALIVAQKLSYEVDTNQEFLAMGSGNLFGSFFSCMPFSASLSRSLIQQVTGGKTQIASLVSCAILLVLLLWIGPIFQFLPRCILASIIVVALRGIFTQAKDLVKFWHLSKLDAMIWLVTFIGVVFLDIEIGLAAGVVASLIVISLQSFKPYACLLGQVPNTDLYLDIGRNPKVEEIDNIKIFRYTGGLNFASRLLYKNKLYRTTGIDPNKILSNRNRQEKLPLLLGDNFNLKFLILDFSALTFIDPEGVEEIKNLVLEFEKIGTKILLASTSGPVYDVLKKYENYSNEEKMLVFPTVHDAVIFVKEKFGSQ